MMVSGQPAGHLPEASISSLPAAIMKKMPSSMAFWMARCWAALSVLVVRDMEAMARGV